MIQFMLDNGSFLDPYGFRDFTNKYDLPTMLNRIIYAYCSDEDLDYWAPICNRKIPSELVGFTFVGDEAKMIAANEYYERK